MKWWWERARSSLPPDPRPEQLPRAVAAFATPRASPEEIRATWVGHSTFLLQVGSRNVLTDPIWSRRASPLRRFGPRRFTPPGVPLASLPPIDAVLLSHDHYDHLDEWTVRQLVERFGDAITWFAPLGHRSWLRRRGARRIVELDWWEEASLQRLRVRALPAQHWSSRSHRDRFRRLWASWAIRDACGAAIYFGGDSGWFPGYGEIGRGAGPFDLVLLPIGAYEPRWFMRRAHMNPEEAVRAYAELGGGGVFGSMHWGTFRLTDEDPLEPPERVRAAWHDRKLDPRNLWIPAQGETRRIPVGRGQESAIRPVASP